MGLQALMTAAFLLLLKTALDKEPKASLDYAFRPATEPFTIQKKSGYHHMDGDRN